MDHLSTFLTLFLTLLLAWSQRGAHGVREKEREIHYQPEQREMMFSGEQGNYSWPYRDQVAIIEGNLTLGALMMVHERDEKKICGKIMPQGGIQALETMLFTIDRINDNPNLLPGIKLGARIKDDCDRDTYGLEQAVDFIRGKYIFLRGGSQGALWLCCKLVAEGVFMTTEWANNGFLIRRTATWVAS